MSRLGELGARLYRGEAAYDFFGRRRYWYALSALIMVVALAGLGIRGFNLGVEFQGGAVFTTPSTSMSVEEAREIAADSSGREARVQRLGNDALRIQVTGLDTDQSNETRAALAKELDIPAERLNAELVGGSWGDQMTSKALQGLLVFLGLVTVYLAIAFEWRMSVGAMVALMFDLVVTVGVYAIVGFEVTPGTVVGVLTILGYSLYDTVVVFDKVREKTMDITKQSRYTYGELANLGVNATLARSVNTSVIALLPVGALLFIGTGLLGGGMLKDISLSLFVGLSAGTVSSIVIATPVAGELKRREPKIREHDQKVLARRAKKSEKQADQEQRDQQEQGESEESDPASGENGSGADGPATAAAGAGVVSPRRQSGNRRGGRSSGRGR